MIIPQNDQKINSIIQKTYNRIKTSPHRIFSDKNNILQELKKFNTLYFRKETKLPARGGKKGNIRPLLADKSTTRKPKQKNFFTLLDI
ncbi:hypothetical protein [Acetobacter okinawensis]|uniref:hypothetical protein n=1 Tax=Acetobacter okinawensis TaxID=1076594 RepID=UPI000ADF1BBD|nr:hypothetical protein [Acetobacter okinawensis]